MPQESESQELVVAVVDDEPAIRTLLSEVLFDAGFQSLEFQDGPACIDAVRRREVDVVFSDINMPHMSGLELLSAVKSIDQSIEVVMMTAQAELDTAIRATRFGALDYLQKPFENLQEIATLAQVAVTRVRENRREADIVEEHRLAEERGFVLSGRLDGSSLVHLLQGVDSFGQDGVLAIEADESAAIWFKEGAVVYAVCGDQEGEKALYRAMRISCGSYRMQEWSEPDDHLEEVMDVESCVLESSWRCDEVQDLLLKLPALNQQWKINPACELPLGELNEFIITVLAAMVSEDEAGEALEIADYYDLDILKGIFFLCENQAVLPGSSD